MILALLVPAPLSAADDERRLSRLRREASALAEQNRLLGAEQTHILGQLDELTAARDVAAEELAAAGRRLDEVNLLAETWLLRESQAGLDEAAALQDLGARLRRLERLGPGARFAALGAAPTPTAALEAMRSLTDGMALDRRAVSRARRAGQEADQARLEVAAARRDLEQADEQARLAEAGALEAVQRYQAQLKQVQREARLYEKAAQEMTEAAGQLEAFLAGERDQAPAGPALERLRGVLPWPSAGEVVQGFGPRRHRRFGTLVPHNGLAIGAPRGADVRVVADGRVVFADWFQGYGRTVIVEHGGGLMTVQSHLSAVVVEPGQAVQQGQLLGLVGDSGSLEGVMLYFEVRQDGAPVDPRQWLRSPPAG